MKLSINMGDVNREANSVSYVVTMKTQG